MTTTTNTQTQSNKKEVNKEHFNHLKSLPTTSSKIRYLNSKNYSRGEIVTIMTQHLGRPIRYQHVRNVLITPLTGPKVLVVQVPQQD
jgi:hypothetical protein